ncbi:hypothetical protein INT48_009091 [Thamnidium elegans]|uniref:Uncharacterized protein n=1 Tax=Thamnidium elegans TaxID=101142 RepID=A0A8H7SRY1_9FUNG|nr:hypothetical protein INT48_009091 [Thamnidium elegans]
MASLQYPLTDSNGNITTISDPTRMIQYAQEYYQMLYSIELVEPTDIINYLDRITFDRTLDRTDAKSLELDIDLDVLTDQTNRVSKSNSPGVDGLGYPFLAVLFRIPCLKQLVLDLYNDA